MHANAKISVPPPFANPLPFFVWDLNEHPVSLGGALTLRVEAELLAQVRGNDPQTEIEVLVRETPSADQVGLLLLRRIFLASAEPFNLTTQSILPLDGTWPDALARGEHTFEYYGYDRVISLHRQHGIEPRLKWSAGTRFSAQSVRRSFGDRLYCVHLRNSGGGVEESNADVIAWQRFFRAQSRPGQREFLLLGDDALGAGWKPVDGVYRAADIGIDLITQLAMVEQSDGYLGMASGLGCAANFSEVPHVLLKHPAHHPTAMQRELGEADSYPFFTVRQAIWRRPADFTTLQEAFAFIQS